MGRNSEYFIVDRENFGFTIFLNNQHKSVLEKGGLLGQSFKCKPCILGISSSIPRKSNSKSQIGRANHTLEAQQTLLNDTSKEESNFKLTKSGNCNRDATSLNIHQHDGHSTVGIKECVNGIKGINKNIKENEVKKISQKD
ncbi:hypothetical protein ACTA71_006716 [Dictyostelium dimigraforme]